MLRHLVVGAAFIAAAAAGITPPDVMRDPSHVELAGRTYAVRYADQHVWLVDGERVVRDLGRGQHLLRYDFTGDGHVDLAVYDDERDGFRNTFAYLEIWPDDGRALENIEPVSAKWKDGHWVWIDLANYPGLDPSTLHGVWFARFMREQDAERAW